MAFKRTVCLFLFVPVFGGCRQGQGQHAVSAKIVDRLDKIESLLIGRQVEEREVAEGATESESPKMSATDLEKLVAEAKGADAAKLSDVVARLDSMIPTADIEEMARKKKDVLLKELRDRIKSEVAALHQGALKAANGAEGQALLSKANEISLRFPMSDSREDMETAKWLLDSQAEVLRRLEVLRRQRYNRWTVEEIEKTLDFFNANVSRWNPFNDNSVLIDSLVEHLAPVDPTLLEPPVMELYNYIIERTKDSISEKNKIELAKRLTDPAVKRKTLGDF